MFKPLCCYSYSGFFSILILSFSSLFLSFHHYSITGANLLPSHPDFNLCQQHLDSKSRLRLVGRFTDSWLGQWLRHCHLPEALVEGQLQWWGVGWAGGTILSLLHWVHSGSAGYCKWTPVWMWVQSSELGRLMVTFLFLGSDSLWSWSSPSLFTQVHAYTPPEESPILTPYFHQVSQILIVSCILLWQMKSLFCSHLLVCFCIAGFSQIPRKRFLFLPCAWVI